MTEYQVQGEETMGSTDSTIKSGSKSELILDQIKQRVRADKIVDVDEERIKMVIFRAGGRRYAFYGRDIREILTPREIAWAPGLPEYLPGLINVRGDVESVIDIRFFLGGERGDCAQCYIALAVCDGFRSGVLVEAVEDVVDIPLSAVRPVLATLPDAVRELVAGEFEDREGLVVLLDLTRLAAKVVV